MGKGFLFAGLLLLLGIGCSSASKTDAAAAPTDGSKPAATKTTTALPAKKGNASAGITCEHKGDKRTLEVVAKDPKGCDLKYTKANKTSVVASSSVSSKHCEQTLAKIKGKLTADGYQCQ